MKTKKANAKIELCDKISIFSKQQHYRESSAPSGKVPTIKSPHTTTYKMHVISSSIICAMLTNRAPICGPKQTLAIDT